MRKSINRRTVLKSAGALAGASAVGAAGVALAIEPNLDAKLIALGEAWEKQNQVWSEAAREASNAEFCSERAYPEPPKGIKGKSWDGKLSLMTREQIEEIAQNPFGNLNWHKEMRDLRMAAYDQWESECRDVHDEYRVDELEKVQTDEWCALCHIEKEILAIPANTMDGLLAKLKIWGDYQEPKLEVDGCDRFVQNAFEDVKRLSGQIGGHHV